MATFRAVNGPNNATIHLGGHPPAEETESGISHDQLIKEGSVASQLHDLEVIAREGYDETDNRLFCYRRKNLLGKRVQIDCPRTNCEGKATLIAWARPAAVSDHV